jgi:transposase
MRLKTILNKVEKYSSFVFTDARFRNHIDQWTFDEDVVIVEVQPRANSQPICSGCGCRGACYDHLERRLFEYVPVWIFKVFFAYAMRRVNCKKCGVTVEMVPWADGKEHITRTYKWFLAQWAKKLAWSEVAVTFRTSWNTVFRSVETAVNWGLANRNINSVKSIGVDELCRKKGHVYATLVYQIDAGCKRLLWIGQERKEDTLRQFFEFFGKKRSAALEAISSDMWKPYINAIREHASQAIHVLDRFHIMSHLSKAIDEIRAGETRKLRDDGYEPMLKKTRWLLLKRPENLTESQEAKLADLLKYNLKSVRAYLLKEEFQQFWEYSSPAWAEKFLARWTKRVMKSRLEPMKAVARMLRNHHDLIFNWFRTNGAISQGIVEGLNGKAKVTIRKSYGYRTFRVMEMSLYHALGDLPMPDYVHRFC